ncbi:MAG: PP2C family protein-serine/threonine phosphatase [Shimia sp.]
MSRAVSLRESIADGLFTMETAYRTDVGCVRKINEDSVFAAPRSGVWLVADGMGGHAAGDFASQRIVARMAGLGVPAGALDLRARVMDRLTQANRDILAHAEDLGTGTIGSTVAAVLIQQDHFAAVWSGDSRVYRLRDANLTRVTKDHTEVQAMIDAGHLTEEEAMTAPRRNVIRRAIGVSETPECDLVDGALLDGDLFVICSDGLTEYFSDAELGIVLRRGDRRALAEVCDDLVDGARDRGGKDNVSVVLIAAHRNALPELEAEGRFPELTGDL